MDGSEYWVEISQHGIRLGAGFLLAKRFVLTALHCLHSCASGNDKVELSFATGHTMRVIQANCSLCKIYPERRRAHMKDDLFLERI